MRVSYDTHGVKMVGCVAVVTLEAAHGAIVFGRGLEVAVEAGQGLVELSCLGRHCEDKIIALSLELEVNRAEGRSAGGASRWIVLYSPVFVGGEKFEAATKNGQLGVALIKVPRTFGCTMRSAQAGASLVSPGKARTGHPPTCGASVTSAGAGALGRRRRSSKVTSWNFPRNTKVNASTSQLPLAFGNRGIEGPRTKTEEAAVSAGPFLQRFPLGQLANTTTERRVPVRMRASAVRSWP